jgi:hypothetical protein
MVIAADSGIVEMKSGPELSESRPYFVSLNGQRRKGSDCKFTEMGTELLSFVEVFAKYLKTPESHGENYRFRQSRF